MALDGNISLNFGIIGHLSSIVTSEIKNFRRSFPEFRLISSINIKRAIEYAETEISETSYGTFYQKILNALSAHFLSIMLRNQRTQGRSEGVVKSKTIGDISVTYADSFSMNDYESSIYGSEYLRLRNRYGCVSVMVAHPSWG